MNIVDIIIIGLVILGAVLGLKRGVFRELVSAVGFILSVVFAFLLKNPLSSLLYDNLPFFKFGGIFKGVSVLNILIYEIIAFLIMLALFMLIVQILKIVTHLLETVLKLTVVLSIPSKIAGAVVGALHFYIIVFIVLYILSLPVISFGLIKDSKFKDPILTKTPLLSAFTNKSAKVFEEFEALKEKYNDKEESTDEFNDEAVDLMLEYKVVTINSVQKLVDKNKIKVSQNILDKYKEE